MSCGPIYKWDVDEEELMEHSKAPIEAWNELFENKRLNKGWVVLEGLTVKQLKEKLENKFFTACEIDGCGVKLLWKDHRFIFSRGIEVREIRSLVCRMEMDLIQNLSSESKGSLPGLKKNKQPSKRTCKPSTEKSTRGLSVGRRR